MSDNTAWGYNKIMKFIHLLRRYPVLWDQDNVNFRNQFQRELAYDEISFAMNTTNDYIRKKIHTMRSQYLAEYKKLKSSEHYSPRWQYFNDFKFIYKHDRLNSSQTTTIDDSEYIQESTCEDGAADESRDCEIHDHDYNIPQCLGNKKNNAKLSNSRYESSKDLPRKRQRLKDDFDQRIYSDDSTTLRSYPYVRDEFTIFGENIATELRLLRGHRSIHDTLKSKILRALKEAKYAFHRATANT